MLCLKASLSEARCYDVAMMVTSEGIGPLTTALCGAVLSAGNTPLLSYAHLLFLSILLLYLGQMCSIYIRPSRTNVPVSIKAMGKI